MPEVGTSISEKKQIHRPKQEFWVVNALGWAIMGGINILFQTDYFTKNPDAYAYSLVIVSFGFLSCFLFRWIILKADLVSTKAFLILPVIIAMQLIFALINVGLFTVVIMLFIATENSWSWDEFIGNVFNLGLVFSIWSLIYVGYLFIEQRGRLQQQRVELMLKLKEAELDNLRKQLSPHFLFNAINNIRSLILIDPEEARKSLLDISDLLRYALNYQKKDSVTVEEEMEIVSSYISLNKIHLKDNVVFEVQVDEEMKDTMIPPMSIQLLVENAIKHGKLINGGLVKVTVSIEEGVRTIEVTNPGELKNDDSDGIGLKNLRQRLESKFGEKARLLISERDNFVHAALTIQT